MNKREELQTELGVLQKKLDELSAISNPRQTDLQRMNDTCDQIEAISTELRMTDVSAGRISGLRSEPNDAEYRKWGEYFQAVAAAGMEPGRKLGNFETGRVYTNVLQTERRSEGLEESTPSLGGFAVQTDFADEIFMRAHKTAKLFPLCRRIPLSSRANSLIYPYIDETSRAAGSRLGGIRSYWQEEGSEKTASHPKFGLMELSLNKLIGLCYATDELLEDAAALGQFLLDGFASEMSFKIDESILRGSGAGQCLGLLNANCLVEISKETGQSSDSLIWTNCVKLFSRLWGGSYDNAVWVINQDIFPELYSMTQPIGTGGAAVFQAADLPKMTLFGRPIIVCEQASTLGDKGDIFLADFSQYLLITKGGLQTARSMHVRFIYDEQTFRFVYRIDGQPLWNSALTPYQGSSNTVSPFLCLAERT